MDFLLSIVSAGLRLALHTALIGGGSFALLVASAYAGTPLVRFVNRLPALSSRARSNEHNKPASSELEKAESEATVTPRSLSEAEVRAKQAKEASISLALTALFFFFAFIAEKKPTIKNLTLVAVELFVARISLIALVSLSSLSAVAFALQKLLFK